MKRIWLAASMFLVIMLTGCVGALKADNEMSEKVSFEANMPANDAYDVVLKHLKIKGYTFELASKETGQINTALFDERMVFLVISGSKLEVVFIDDGDKTTTIVASVSTWRRHIRPTHTTPWEKRERDKDKTKKIAEEIKSTLVQKENKSAKK